MNKVYIAKESFTSEEVSPFKGQIFEMDETKAAELIKEGTIAEYYETGAIPSFDMTELGAKVGETTTIDSSKIKEFREALKKGITNIKFSFNGMKVSWNVLAICVGGDSGTLTWSEVFNLQKSVPTWLVVNVYAGQIQVQMINLATT